MLEIYDPGLVGSADSSVGHFLNSCAVSEHFDPLLVPSIKGPLLGAVLHLEQLFPEIFSIFYCVKGFGCGDLIDLIQLFAESTGDDFVLGTTNEIGQ